MIQIDKEKYYRILKAQGLSAALTELHRDANEIEFETFEGAKCYQPELFDYMKEVRKFSVELWNSQLNDPKLLN